MEDRASMENRKGEDLAIRAAAEPRGEAANDLDIDVNRIVWDPEYRRQVMAELKRRTSRRGEPVR